MSVSIIICGLVRDAERLLRKLSDYRGWQEKGFVDQIVYATWIGELDRYAGLRDQLRAAGVTLVEIEEPRLVLKGGHQLHQAVAFHYALSMIEDDDQFVLKTRVDLADNHELMLHDFAHGTPPADDFGRFGLQNKVLVEYAQMLYPFLCGDAQFFGRKRDLRKLVNMSAEMEVIYNRLAVEQTFFFQPFSSSRLFRRHFYWNLPHISEIANKRDKQLAFVLKTPEMLEVVQAWWVVLDAYFKVGWGPEEAATADISSIEAAFDHNGPHKRGGQDRSDPIQQSAFVKRLIGLLDQTRIQALREAVCDTRVDNPFAVSPAHVEAYEAFRTTFSDLPSAKAARAGSTKILVRGAAQHFFVKSENDEASSRYHEQLTHLRRENALLMRKLGLSVTHTGLHKALNRFLPRKAVLFFKYKTPGLAALYARYMMKKTS